MTQPHTGEPPGPLPPAPAPMTLLVAAVIVYDPQHHRVLLLQRGPNARFARGKWDLPGGKNDPGEPVTETAVRELREETGLETTAESLRPAHLIHGAYGVEALNGYLTVVFAAGEWTGEPENREPHKHSTVQWVDAAALPENFVPSTAHALGRYLDGAETGLFAWGWGQSG